MEFPLLFRSCVVQYCIYKQNMTKVYFLYIFGLLLGAWLTSLQTLGIYSVLRVIKGVLCYVNEIALESP